MKEKIILFVIGILVGSIISTTSIYIYTTTKNSNNQNIEMKGVNSREITNNNSQKTKHKKKLNDETTKEEQTSEESKNN